MKSSKKIALLDPNFSADPIAEAILSRGHQLWRLGVTERGAEHVTLGGQCEWVKLDYRNPQEVASWALAQKIQVLVPGCTDLSFWTAETVDTGFLLRASYKCRKKLRTLRTKKELRSFLTSIGVTIPREFEFPRPHGASRQEFQSVVVKPNDMHSGIGVERVEPATFGRVSAAVARARILSESGTALVEEWVEGRNYGFTAYFRGSQVLETILVRELVSPEWKVFASFVEMSQPELTKKMTEIAQIVGSELGKETGLLHFQFIDSSDGPVILELVERMPGDLYSALAKSVLTDFVEFYLDGFLSEDEPHWGSRTRVEATLLRLTLTSEDVNRLGQIHHSALGLRSAPEIEIVRTGQSVSDRVVAFVKAEEPVPPEELMNLILNYLGKGLAPISPQNSS